MYLALVILLPILLFFGPFKFRYTLDPSLRIYWITVIILIHIFLYMVLSFTIETYFLTPTSYK
jgi:hypothetical protein